ncbi:hypothetical protein CQ010_16775 [Arthrobacter sp. MYb211]|nr:hypothetical protein CIK76_17465 [Glutamicibacter sp. BW80]PRA09899.1 hypothetical protein CQ015_16760 [Arthrobacter sp. MYb221]PRC04907.1 hypothetical protein CQ010_16775 [Arthrobacter sp. MYb211]
MVDNFPGERSEVDYSANGHQDPIFTEHALLKLNQQCLPLPEVDVAIDAMNRATNSTIATNSKADVDVLRHLALLYLESFRNKNLSRGEHNKAIMNVASIVVSLRAPEARLISSEEMDSLLLKIYLYFFLEESTPIQLVNSLLK